MTTGTAERSHGRGLPHSFRAMSTPPRDTSRFRRNLVRVMAVQVVTLLLLWLLQHRYSV